MQKLGLDCPTNWLEFIQPMADYDYVLVEKCLKDRKYLDFFKRSPREKILNNRLMGTDTSRVLSDVLEVWKELGGQVIAPDWGNDHGKTLEGYKECCRLIPRENVIGVVQTTNCWEVEECIQSYGGKVAVGFDVGSEHEDEEINKVYRRIKVVLQLRFKKVHLLGMTNPGELFFYKGLDHIDSINTGLPILLGFSDMSLLGYKRIKDVSSYNYMNMDYFPYDKDVYNLIEGNVSSLRQLLWGKE